MNSDIKQQILKDPANKACFDCEKENPEWVSLNNAVLLCKDCQLKHRSFGVSISYIRSLELDLWKEDQIAILKLGGNQRLKDLISVYNIKSNHDRHELYFSKLLDYYRKLLKAELRGEVRPQPPSDEEAINSIEDSKTVISSSFPESRGNVENKNSSNFDNMNVEHNEEPKSDNSVYGLFGSLWNKSKDIASTLKNKVDETGVTETIKKGSTVLYGKVKEGASELGTYGQKAIAKTTELASTGVEYSKEKINDIVSFYLIFRNKKE